MKSSALALLLTASFFFTVIYAAEPVLLEPGIYRLDPDGYLNMSKGEPWNSSEIIEDKFEHALPPAAHIGFAVVSRHPDRAQNRVLFLVDDLYRYDGRRQDNLCTAYAFPDWNSHSKSEPFCRTKVSNDEAVFNWTNSVFTVSWRSDRKHLRTALDDKGDWNYAIEVTHYGDRFVLTTPHAYQSVRYLTKDVPFFSSASRSTSTSVLPAGSYVAVVESGSEWEEVDHFAQDGTSTRGWIDRDDLQDIKWVDQQAKTKQFRFRIAFSATADDDAHATAVAVEVINRKTGNRAQVIRDFYAEPWGENDTSLRIIDANFDGHPDLRFGGSSGGAGPNNTSNFFLFDAKSGRFVFDEVLSDLSQIELDTHKKLITSAQRGGCCSHSSQTWRYKNGRLVEIANWDESLTVDGEWVETTIGRLRNGKMHYRSTRKRAR